MIFLYFLVWVTAVLGRYTIPPTWVTSNLVRAGNNFVIRSLTGNGKTPNYTFTFSSNLSGIPYLGYGIKAYEGSDFLGEQKFQVNRTDLNSTSFSVSVQILGTTNIFKLNVPYIAIDPTFPHHINSFDNVPVNYMAGPIVNISTSSDVTQIYTNTINYTQQASGLTYTTFRQPLTQNKILLFLTSLFFRGLNQQNTTPVRPINITVNSLVVSVSQYQISVSLSINVTITKIHFSIVVFDEIDVMSSGIYMLVYERIDLPYTGGFIPVPVEFIDNFIMGLLDFSTNQTQTVLVFSWIFNYVDGVHGVFMPQSVVYVTTKQPINRITYTLFYMKTWICPNQTYFDPSINLCTSCPIINCIDCSNLTACSKCDQNNNYYLNSTTMQCFQCKLNENNFCSSNFKVIEDSFQLHITDCNRFTLQFRTDSQDLLSKIQQAYFINNDIRIVSSKVSNDQAFFFVEYYRDIYNETLKLSIPSSYLILISHNQGIPLLKYNDNQCQIYGSSQKLVEIIQISSYIVFIISILSCKIIGLQLFGILQLSYFSLGEHDFLNIYLSPLIYFKRANGYNIPFISQNSQLPPNIRILDISASFINNCNIMILLMFAQLFISLILYVISKVMGSKKLLKISLKLLKQGFITIVMLNIFNIAFSAAIHWKYSDPQGPAYILSSFLLYITIIIILVALVCMQYSKKSQYGQFRLKFKDTFSCRSYITLSIIYRMSLGFFIAYKNDYTQETLLIQAISLTFILYNLINLPFSDYIHNYRCNIIHITHLVILFCANYYRSMKLNTPMSVKGHFHTVAILEIVMIVVCLVISVMAAVYELIKKIKQICKPNKVSNIQISSQNQNNSTIKITQETIDNF